MSIIINAKGTSVPTFTVGKNGLTLSQNGTLTPPTGNNLAISLAADKSLVVGIGSVGIGTTTPSTKLEVRRSESSAAYVIPTSTTLNNDSAVAARFSYGIDDSAITAGVGIGLALSATPHRGEAYIVQTHPTTSKDSGDLSFWTTSASVASEKVRITADGNVGIGTTTPQQQLVVSKNTTPIQALDSNQQVLHLIGANGQRTRFLADAYAESSGFTLRRTNGTAASPTAILSSQLIGFMNAHGYNGTAYSASPAIDFAASENWSPTALGSLIRFSTVANGTTTSLERVRIDQNGNVGIGVDAPISRLDVVDNNSTISIRDPRDASVAPTAQPRVSFFRHFGINEVARVAAVGTSITGNTTNEASLVFSTANGTTISEAMRINALGNVGIGTANVQSKLDIVGGNGDGIQYRTSTRTVGIGQIANEASVYWGSGTALTFFAGLERMRIDASGNVGIGLTNPATRLGMVSGSSLSWGATNFSYIGGDSSAGILALGTQATERMRITSAGSVCIGTTSSAVASLTHAVALEYAGGGSTFGIGLRQLADNTTAITFANAANNTIGTIATTASATSFNTTSDARLKDNIVDAPSAIAKVKSIQVRSFDWKSDKSHVEHGFIAQEHPTDPFSIEDVASGIADKLIRRHPHVFGDVQAKSSEEVKQNWEELKRAEKGRNSATDGVALAQPALPLITKLIYRAEKNGIKLDLPTTDIDNDVSSEVAIGDALVAAVVAAIKQGIEPEDLLRARAREIAEEIRRIESL